MDYVLNTEMTHALARITTDFDLAAIDMAAKRGIDVITMPGDLTGLLREEDNVKYNNLIREPVLSSAAIYCTIIAVLIVLGLCAFINKENPGLKGYMHNNQDKSQVNLYYEIYGKGAPLLFLHGFGTNIYSWRYWVNPLSEQYRVILVDLKGYGSSPKPYDKHYSIPDQATLIYRFILQHDLRNLTIIGHSFGGGVALMTALYLTEQDPSRLVKLILIDSIGYEQPLPQFIKLLRRPIVGRLLPYLLPIKMQVRSILQLAYYDDDKISDEAVTVYAKALDTAEGRYALIQTARQIVPVNVKELISRYKTIKVPTLILWGREDKIAPLEVGNLLHQAISHSELAIIDQCGHIPHEEEPDKALTIVERFLKINDVETSK